MKKIIWILLFLLPMTCYAEKREVTLQKCVDGDTAYFNDDNKIIKVRFLAIDTPETKHPTKGKEPWGKEASKFTCAALTKATKIELENDTNATVDKYNRTLVWVFVDDQLLQDLLVKNGLAEVAYLYDDYKYTPLLQDHEAIAKKEKLGIWGEYRENQVPYYVAILILCILLCLISTSYRKKIWKKTKRQVIKEIKKKRG